MHIRVMTSAGTHPIAADQVAGTLASGAGTVWVDLDHTEDAGLDLLAQLMHVDAADVKECHLRTPVPKLHVYPDHHFSAINGLARGVDGRLYFQPLKTFLNDRCLFTVVGPSNEALTHEAAHRELVTLGARVDGGQFRPTSALSLVGEIRRDMLQEQERLIGIVAHEAGEIERRVLRSDPVRSEKMLLDLFSLRHDLQTIRTNAAQTHESYSNLIETLESQTDALQVDLGRIRTLRQGYGHLINSADLEREYLQEMLDLFQTRVATELNRFVREVTAWGTVAVACTLVSGIYGMNFTHMPELSFEYGYPAALGLMVALGIGLITLFRRRGWL